MTHSCRNLYSFGTEMQFLPISEYKKALKSISQDEKQSLLDEKMMIEMFDENIKRIKAF